MILFEPERSCIWFDRDIKNWNSVGTPGCKSWLFSYFNPASSYSLDKCKNLLIFDIAALQCCCKIILYDTFFLAIGTQLPCVTIWCCKLDLCFALVWTILNILWKFYVAYILRNKWLGSGTKQKCHAIVLQTFDMFLTCLF